MKLAGIHHVTAIASDPAANAAFYTQILGLRLVKQTVNFDDPSTYHLYYGDDAGSPGTILTFFPWPNDYDTLLNGTEKDCTDEQWKKLKELSELNEQTETILAKIKPSALNISRVFIQEGWTIFEFQKSFLSSFNKKTSLPPEMQTEIVAATSVFCAPTSTLYGLWPYHTPSYGAASDTLKRIGENTLAIRAGQLLAD